MPLKYTDEQDRAVGAGRAEQEQGEMTGLESREATGLETSEATGWFTVDGAIEKIGFGYPQLRIFVICKLIVVSTFWMHCIAVRANNKTDLGTHFIYTGTRTVYTVLVLYTHRHTHSIHTGTRNAQHTHRHRQHNVYTQAHAEYTHRHAHSIHSTGYTQAQ